MKVISSEWKQRMVIKINDYHDLKKHFTVNSDYAPASKWLCKMLADYDIPFKAVNLGAGAMRITTDICTCPVCKRPLTGGNKK